MKKYFSKEILLANKNIFLGFVVCITIAIATMAFQDSTKVNNSANQARLDTIPKNDNLDINVDLKDIDKTIKQSLEMAEKSMKDIDWNRISKQIEQSMKQIDMAKLQMEINNSMKAIDWEKMRAEINRSMKEIDMSKMKLDIEKEVRDAMKNINTDELKKSMEEIKKINFDQLKKEMEKMKIEMELNKDKFKIDMEKFKLDMEKVKADLSELKEMTSEMEKDGLINKKESNTIEYKNKELFINGKKQSPEVTEKYRKYFKGDNLKFNFSNND